MPGPGPRRPRSRTAALHPLHEAPHATVRLDERDQRADREGEQQHGRACPARRRPRGVPSIAPASPASGFHPASDRPADPDARGERQVDLARPDGQADGEQGREQRDESRPRRPSRSRPGQRGLQHADPVRPKKAPELFRVKHAGLGRARRTAPGAARRPEAPGQRPHAVEVAPEADVLGADDRGRTPRTCSTRRESGSGPDPRAPPGQARRLLHVGSLPSSARRGAQRPPYACAEVAVERTTRRSRLPSPRSPRSALRDVPRMRREARRPGMGSQTTGRSAPSITARAARSEAWLRSIGTPSAAGARPDRRPNASGRRAPTVPAASAQAVGAFQVERQAAHPRLEQVVGAPRSSSIA